MRTIASVRLPFTFAKRYHVLISSVTDASAEIVFVPPLTTPVLQELRRYLNLPLQFREVPEAEFGKILSKTYESGTDQAMDAISGMEGDVDLQQLMQELPNVEDLLESEDDAPVIRLLNAVLSQAIKQNASDIHFETFENRFVVRFRMDGVMHEILEPPRVLASLIVSRIKIMSKLDIAEKRLPQDGRIALRIAGRAVDVRVSTVPTYYGERIVLRILDQQAAPLDLTKLGMAPEAYKRMKDLIARPNGILLVTGPTGSGKSTTLYAALTELNDGTQNILTIEDPIEYYLQGVGQMQVNAKVNMTFARGLRAILRQDPDVVMVGEIRDLETAEMAVQASLTGHLVLSTLHTNSATGAVTRLRDMGVEPFLISSTLVGVLAQRLIRLLCPHCKQEKEATQAEMELMHLPKTSVPPKICMPVGCALCNQMGYLGRTGIYELITVDERIREMIHRNSTEHEMERYAHTLYPSMQQDGYRRVLSGETSLAEVMRVTSAR